MRRDSRISIFCERKAVSGRSQESVRQRTHPQQLLKRLILDAHVLDGIQQRHAVREPPLNLLDALEGLHPRLNGLEVFGKEDTDMRDTIEGGKEDGNDGKLSLVVGAAGANSDGRGGCALLGGGGSGTRGAVEEDVHDVLVLSLLVGGERLSLRVRREKSALRWQHLGVGGGRWKLTLGPRRFW